MVEHQLVRVTLGVGATTPDDPAPPPVEAVDEDRRWALVQEVRLVSPAGFKAFLAPFQTQASPMRQAALMRSQDTLHGLKWVVHSYLREPLIDALVAGTVLDDLEQGGAVLVELSAAAWVKTRAVGAAGEPTPVQYLPGGVQRALLAAEADYFAMPQGSGWTLAVVPFLGRLQAPAADGLDPNPPPPRPLREDPVLHLHRTRKASSAPAHLDAVALTFTSRADQQDRSCDLGWFDGAARQRWERLDPATLAEEWFRVQSPPPETALPQPGSGPPPAGSVLAALPAEGPGRLSRAAALRGLFATTRAAIPPAAGPIPPQPPQNTLVWRDGALLVLDAWDDKPAPIEAPDQYAFHAAGARLLEALRDTVTPGRAARIPAVTLLPPPMSRFPSEELLQPVGFAVSPYLGVSFTAVPQPLDPSPRVAVFADLLAVDRSGQQLVAVAASVWQRRADPAHPAADPEVPGDDQIRRWGNETWTRLAGDSRIGVLRLREVYRDARTGVRLRFVFFLLSRPPAPTTTRVSALPVRAELGQLRFPEPGCHRAVPPRPEFDHELAPPRVRSVTPLHRTEPQGGYAAVRLDVELTGDARGVSGAVWAGGPRRAWWLACPHHVQYTAPGTGRLRLLPRNFRSRAIRGLPPALPDVPLPTDAALAGWAGPGGAGPLAAVAGWQPVLPGCLRWLAVGGRAGAFFAFRPHLLTQQPGDALALASGAVPVQHRFPRPVPLPPNRHGGQADALAPWGEWFDLDAAGGEQKSVAVGTLPADSGFLATKAGSAGVLVELVEPFHPDRGAVSLKAWREPPAGVPAFRVRLRFTRLGADAQTAWPATVALVDGTFACRTGRRTLSPPRARRRSSRTWPATRRSRSTNGWPGWGTVRRSPGRWRSVRLPGRST